jgi:hypothetical protein
MRRSGRLAVAVALLVLGGCAGSPTQPAERIEAAEAGPAAGAPTASGIVREIVPDPAAPGTRLRLLVEHPGQAEPADRSIVHAGPGTAIFVREGGRLRGGGPGDLRVGAEHVIWTTGVELRSYPRQVFATRIEVLR